MQTRYFNGHQIPKLDTTCLGLQGEGAELVNNKIPRHGLMYILLSESFTSYYVQNLAKLDEWFAFTKGNTLFKPNGGYILNDLGTHDRVGGLETVPALKLPSKKKNEVGLLDVILSYVPDINSFLSSVAVTCNYRQHVRTLTSGGYGWEPVPFVNSLRQANTRIDENVLNGKCSYSVVNNASFELVQKLVIATESNDSLFSIFKTGYEQVSDQIKQAVANSLTIDGQAVDVSIFQTVGRYNDRGLSLTVRQSGRQLFYTLDLRVHPFEDVVYLQINDSVLDQEELIEEIRQILNDAQIRVQLGTSGAVVTFK